MKALLVIDMQNICVGDNHAEFFKYDNSKIIKAVNEAINSNTESVVIYIRNLMKRNLLNKLAPFQAYEGMEEVELVNDLHIVSDHIFNKYSGNALTNNELISFLQSNNVDEIEVVGVDGGGCVALTALGAIKNGYKVIVNQNAIGTMFNTRKDKYFAKLKKQGAIFR